MTPLFRPVAIAERAVHRKRSFLLEHEPRWLSSSHALLAAAFAIVACVLGIGRTGEYVSGPALVRILGRTTITSPASEVVDAVFVEPDRAVRAGDAIVRFANAKEESELARIDREIETSLAITLRDSSNDAARAKLASLRAEQQLARARLDQRIVRAPSEGVITDIRVRSGQAVEAGEVLAAITRGDGSGEIVAVVPGEYRPVVRVGLAARLELDGYSRTPCDVVVTRVADEVIGPADVERALGKSSVETLHVTGPSLLVTVSLPANGIPVEGEPLAVFDGMRGVVRIRVRTRPLLAELLPWPGEGSAP